MSNPAIEAVLFDVGGTLVHEADPGTAVAALTARAVDGAIESLGVLAADYRLGAVTNTSVMAEADVRALLDPIGLSGPLEVLVTSCDVGVAKPDPAPILHALQRLGVKPKHALYVGDRDSDQLAARRAGCGFAWAANPPHLAVERHRSRATSPALRAAAGLTATDAEAASLCRERVAGLATPPGGLGQLADIAERLSAIAGSPLPPPPDPVAVCVFVADHGVAAHGVTAWPSSLTLVVAEEAAAGGAAISTLAESVGATLSVVDVGTVEGVDRGTPVRRERVRGGTASLADGPAMTETEAVAAMDVGARLAEELTSAGARCLVPGEIGIGNTTSAACLVGALTGRDALEVVGRGAGADGAVLERKIDVVDRALRRVESERDPVALLAEVGGLEIAAIAGFVIAAAGAGTPVILDGVVTHAAALAAARLAPELPGYLLAGHVPPEPASPIALGAMGLTAILQLEMAVGEGTGGCLAVPIVRAAARCVSSTSTIADVLDIAEPEEG